MKNFIKIAKNYHTKNGETMKSHKNLKFSYPIIGIIFLFMIISCITIYSAMTYLPSYLGNLAIKQASFYILGIILAFVLIKIPNKWIQNSIIFAYIIGNILLFLLLFFGKNVNGSKCWFILPGVGSFQPSEFMKIILILMISKTTSDFFKKKTNPTIKEEFIFLLKIMGIVLIPSILTFLEPDTGAVIIYLLIVIGILIISPLRKRWLIISFLVLTLFSSIFFYLYFQKQDLFVDLLGTDLFYRIDRVLDWKKGEGMQLENSLTAIGSSGLLGHGYNKTPLYFPESGTDFIFSVFASNFGLIGSILFIILITSFDLFLLNMAKEENNFFFKYTIIGIVSMFLYQQIQNISMTFGLLPITGITLPFISYGGSSLLAYLIAIGIVLNMSLSRETN